MRIFELQAELAKIEELENEWALTHEGDLTDFPYLLELGELKGSIEQKALSISSWIVNLAAEQKALKEAAKTLTDRARVKANKIQSLKEYVGSVLEPGTKLENEECKISWRKSTALEILCDTEMLPSMYQKISVSVDKVGITKDIKAGKTIKLAA